MSAPRRIIGRGMIAIGIGCRSGVTGAAIADLVAKTLTDNGLDDAPAALFAPVEKQGEPAIPEAAGRLGLALVFLPKAALQAASPAAETRSERVVELFGVPSVAETAALAGAGPGARLLVKRVTAGGVTCAVAGTGPSPAAPEPETAS
jgi:cobalt-precorrin 5A hydrolase